MSEELVGPDSIVHMKSYWLPSMGTCSKKGQSDPELKSQENEAGKRKENNHTTFRNPSFVRMIVIC